MDRFLYNGSHFKPHIRPQYEAWILEEFILTSSPLWTRNNTVYNIQDLYVYIYIPVVAKSVKNLPATQETWVQSLGQKDPLENEIATHCSILAWKILEGSSPLVGKRWT